MAIITAVRRVQSAMRVAAALAALMAGTALAGPRNAPPLIAPPPPASTSAGIPPGTIIGVIVRIDSDGEGRLTQANVSRTIPIAPGYTAGKLIDLPEPYMKAVRAKLATLRFTPASTAYRYFVYDPLQPARIDIGPDPAVQE